MGQENLLVDKLLEKLMKGEIKPYEVERELEQQTDLPWEDVCRTASDIRLRYIERVSGVDLSEVRRAYVPTENVSKRTTGIELKVGGAVTPLGIAGPVKINGEYAKGEFFIPLATNEAALVAGINRGIKAINLSGGVRTVVTYDGMTRAPVLKMPDIRSAKELCEQIRSKGELYQQIKRAAESESRYSKLIDIRPYQMGRYVWLRFVFQTGNAMGMNSATRYTANGVAELLNKVEGAELVALSGNMCTDKKPAFINILEGRGKSVHAEVLIPKDVLETVYHTTPRTIEKTNLIKVYLGSSYAGTVGGYNANAANTVAAMFIALGQDAAQVVNSSDCYTVAEAEDDNLRFSVYMPDIHVGTVGGGTGYGTARELLKLIGCSEPDDKSYVNARKLAEIVAAAVTAQELNLIATLANEWELAESHISLARGKGES